MRNLIDEIKELTYFNDHTTSLIKVTDYLQEKYQCKEISFLQGWLKQIKKQQNRDGYLKNYNSKWRYQIFKKLKIIMQDFMGPDAKFLLDVL